MGATAAGELLLKLANLHTKFLKRLSGPLSAHGISFTEYQVLLQLREAPEGKLRRIDLAEQVGLSASGITRVLNPMQKIGLVNKEENARDARVSLVTLSSAGKKIFREASTSFEQTAEELFKGISSKEVAALTGLARALL
jgi:DNA-binding MarR family transcriptional regulator